MGRSGSLRFVAPLLLATLLAGTALAQSTVYQAAQPRTFEDNASRGFWKLTARATAPTTPATGEVYLDDGTNTWDGNSGFRRYDGSAWKDISPGEAYNVKSYGAKGDGSTDDTAAIQAAIDAATAAAVKVVRFDLTSEPLDNTATGGASTVFFPPGKYKITDTLTYGYYNRFAGDRAIIWQTDPTKDVFYSTTCYQNQWEGLIIVGGRTHIHAQNGVASGLEGCLIKVTNCEFQNAASYAVNFVKSAGAGGEQGIINNCRFWKNSQDLYSRFDFCTLTNSWLEKGDTEGAADAAWINTRNLSFTDNVIVPGGDFSQAGYTTRYFDNYGSLRIERNRFGSEGGGGMPLVYNFTDALATSDVYPYMAGRSVVVRGNYILAMGGSNRVDDGVVILKTGIPKGITIEDNCYLFDTPLIRTNLLASGSTFLDYMNTRGTPGVQPRLRIKIKNNVGWGVAVTDAYSATEALRPWLETDAMSMGTLRRVDAVPIAEVLGSAETSSTGWTQSNSNISAAYVTGDHNCQELQITATADAGHSQRTYAGYLVPTAMTANQVYTLAMRVRVVATTAPVKMTLTLAGEQRSWVLPTGRYWLNIPFWYGNGTGVASTTWDRLVYTASFEKSGDVLAVGRQILYRGAVDFQGDVLRLLTATVPTAITAALTSHTGYFPGDVAINSSSTSPVQWVNATKSTTGEWYDAAGGADDTAYDATSWDNNTDAATKNALRDKFESLGGGGFDATALDDLTWSDGANAANTWTFNVSGTDTTLIFGSAMLSLSHDLTVTGSDILVGAAGVKLTGDGDGALTLLGLGDGYDEDLTLNLDDTENTGTFTSSTGLATLNFSSIALQESGVGVLNNDEIDASVELAAIMDDETGTAGALVFSDSPTFVDDITLATAGVLLTGANGSLTILGKGDGQDEDIKLDLNTTANTLTITSPTSSLDKIDASGITITATFAGALTGNVTGDVSGSSGSCTGTAAVATAVTITDNESTAENNPLVFVADGDLDGGNLGLETDGDAYYTPSTGIITATGFAGALTGNVTGDVSGNAGTVTNGVYTGDAGTVFLAPDGDGSSLSGVVTSESDPVVGAVSGIVKADGKTSISAATGADVNDLWGSVRNNLVYASPDGSPGTAIFRALVADDIPDLSGTYLTAEVDGDVSNELPTAGNYIDVSGTQVAVDPTEMATVTFGAGAEMVWTFDGSGGTDVTLTFGDGTANFSAGLQVGGSAVLTAEVDGDTTNEIEVEDEVFSAANFDGDTAKGVSQDDFYDLWHGIDTDDDGDIDAIDATVWATKQDSVTEGSLTDSVIVSADIKDGEVGAADCAANMKTFAINFVIDGGGSEIADNVQLWAEVPCSGTITAARLLADQSGSIVVDVWKDTYANYPPTNDDSITSATPPTISGAVKSEDVTLTSWTTTVTAGDIIKINVDSCTTITKCVLVLSGTKS